MIGIQKQCQDSYPLVAGSPLPPILRMSLALKEFLCSMVLNLYVVKMFLLICLAFNSLKYVS